MIPLWLLVDHGGGPLICTLEDAGTIVEWRAILRHKLGGAARWIHLSLCGALPWCAPPHAEASNIEADTWVACHCTVTGVEGGDGLALVHRLDTLIWELAKAIVGTVKVANLIGQATARKQGVDEGIACSSWQRSAQASLRPLDTLLVIDIACSPLVGDGMALSQALVHIEAVWDLCNAHHTAVVMVLASTLETNNLIVQCHLLAFRIAGLLPVSPARPHPAISAVASAGVIGDWALAWECWDGEAIRPLGLANGEVSQRIVPRSLVLFDVRTACVSNSDNREDAN